MALPSTQKKWVIMGQEKGYDELNFTDGPIPSVGDYGVLVKLHAASLNYRDHMIPKGTYIFHLHLPVVGGSDGAGEVIEVGPKVTKWKKGDRVTTLFNPGHQSGPMTRAIMRNGSIGGSFDGTWQQYGVYEENWLVRLASNLSYLEGASLSDCGLTAWNALYGLKAVKPGDWVLVQGTGGVSLFAIQFAKAGGAKVVATTSSTSKYELLQRLGVDHIVNYLEDKDWGVTARNFTPNEEGFDHILDVGGQETLPHSVKAIKPEGIITVIGILTGVETKNASILDALLNTCTFRGIHIGSRDQMDEMMAAIDANKIQPVLDKRVFKLEELREGLEYMEARKHTGKVVIEIP
ncbi:zinc-binding dehydrogenase domain-containing protein [Trichoderma breve]|uniref:Zinc-binding dehydrogenase domain-containing protein n=1 Tax=Trichoderma breve TaxID=2034170 RepID=A0A9W9E6Y9_9HYPO|nr:zinc-binding dehydrogenase domain-containing protein [Trichoderma breve]KAJ4861333.1 zinc-binding dehydrogenase domain-containing protein [Trichoderma breve]